jgi:hypothetical protein
VAWSFSPSSYLTNYNALQKQKGAAHHAKRKHSEKQHYRKGTAEPGFSQGHATIYSSTQQQGVQVVK